MGWKARDRYLRNLLTFLFLHFHLFSGVSSLCVFAGLASVYANWIYVQFVCDLNCKLNLLRNSPWTDLPTETSCKEHKSKRVKIKTQKNKIKENVTLPSFVIYIFFNKASFWILCLYDADSNLSTAWNSLHTRTLKHKILSSHIQHFLKKNI